MKVSCISHSQDKHQNSNTNYALPLDDDEENAVGLVGNIDDDDNYSNPDDQKDMYEDGEDHGDDQSSPI